MTGNYRRTAEVHAVHQIEDLCAVHYFVTFDADGAAMGGGAGREAVAGEAAAGDLFKYCAIGMS